MVSCVKVLDKKLVQLSQKGVDEQIKLAEKLQDEDKGIHYVSINPNTKEMLIRYDGEKLNEESLAEALLFLTTDSLLYVVPEIISDIFEQDFSGIVTPKITKLQEDLKAQVDSVQSYIDNVNSNYSK